MDNFPRPAIDCVADRGNMHLVEHEKGRSYFEGAAVVAISAAPRAGLFTVAGSRVEL